MDQQLIIDLQRTVEFIKKHRWTRGALSRRRRRKSVPGPNEISPLSPEAHSFCLLGAAMRANDIRLKSLRLNSIDLAVMAETGRDAHHYNDFVAKDKRYIIRMLNRIIKKHSRG